MEEISPHQKKRLAHIDFRLYFLGSIGRNHLVKRFGIKEAAATRDISLYREHAAKNIEYDGSAKLYRATDVFHPLFNHKAESVLAALSQGIGDDSISDQQSFIPCETPSQLSKPDLSILATLTKAIYNQKIVSIEYRSVSSGFTKREIAPFCLVDNGLRWHIRAYDRRRERFTDFVITRITKPKILHDSKVLNNEEPQSDIQWNRIAELELVAHPKLDHKETIEIDYGMTNGILNVNVRAAVAGYLLRRWNVDCTENGELEGNEYHLWLKNRMALYGVENLIIAPGIKQDPV
ncbi:transcriptional regulator [Microbulbifer sp. JMSA003]|uniref:transcriptional regulator n=1 Tax=Microbulbifer sp. JMSA003 TaxID=3243369 RepID=UPI004039FCE4